MHKAALWKLMVVKVLQANDSTCLASLDLAECGSFASYQISTDID